MESAPINYGEKSTEELLALLVSEEDRVTEAHIRELAQRSDAVGQLTEWLTDKEPWFEAEFGDWWGLYHAFTILCLRGQPEDVGTVLQGLKYATLTNNDWITEIAPTALASFGPAGIERMIQFVNDERPAQSLPLSKSFVSMRDYMGERHGWENQFDGGDTTHWRGRVCTGLTRIGLEHPAERARIADFLCSRFSGPAELDATFLGFIVLDALVLDREQALEPLRHAYESKRVDPTIAGKYEDAIIAKGHTADYWEYKKDLLDFYSPTEIAKRQERWDKEDDEDDDELNLDALRQILEASPLRKPPALQGFDAHHPTAPAGYKETDDGVFVRVSEKVGRNDPCPCGSGKKYKKCCGKEQ